MLEENLRYFFTYFLFFSYHWGSTRVIKVKVKVKQLGLKIPEFSSKAYRRVQDWPAWNQKVNRFHTVVGSDVNHSHS